MFSHILVAWDGSDNARQAFEYGLEIAARFQARVEIIAVARSSEHAETSEERESTLQEARRFYERRSEELLDAARRKGIETKLIVAEGTHPAEELIATARKLGTDLLIVGRRGMSPVARFLMGSVSDRVARYSPCPVLVVGTE